jgi:tetratricopeptide (TPR) repeat protein
MMAAALRKMRACWPAAQTAVGLAVLLLAAFAVYWPCLKGSFLWDDDVMLTQNPLVKSSSGLRGIWFSTQPFDYCPLTLTSFWIEWQLWRLQPAGYHVTNVLLHALSAFLLWRILARLKVPGAFVAAAVFAVHPVCVASVAWIAERKNTLSLLFFLLSLLWYLRFDEQSKQSKVQSLKSKVGSQESAFSDTRCATRNTFHVSRFAFDSLRYPPSSLLYALSLLAFALALFSKASVVMLPCVLLLCCWWRRDRITRLDLLRTAPFFLLALAFGLVTVWFQSHRAMGGPEQHTDPLLVRILGGTWAVWFYLAKALAPVNLTLIYPRWAIPPAWLWSYVPGLLLLGVFAVLWRYRAGWARPLLFGFGYFVVTLLPVLGLFDTYYFSLCRVADHWQYLSVIGIIALAVGLVAACCSNRSVAGRDFFTAPEASSDGALRTARPTYTHPLATGLAVLVLAALALGSWKRAAIYAHPTSLWRDAAAKTPQSPVTRNHYGNALEAEGKLDEAIAQYAAVQRFMPANVDACVNLGIALTKKGELDGALAQLRRALELNPRDPAAHFNLASVLSRQGKYDEAIPHYHEALRSYFYRAEAHNSLGNLYSRQGKTDAAIAQYREAIRLDPGFAQAHLNLANLLVTQGQLQEALTHYALAAQANPALPEARYNLGRAAMAGGRYGEAADHFRAALATQTDFAEAHHNLGLLLERQGRTDDALAQYEAALKAKPDHAQTHYVLGNALLKRKQPALARGHYEAALKFQPDYAEAHYQLGVLLLADKDAAGASRHWQAALRLKPDWLELLNNLAWLLATNPDPNVRDGTQAVKLASRAAELTGQRDPGALDTLAAAYAEAGQFKEAVAAAERGLKLAEAAGDKGLVDQLQARLELYRAGRPWRE